MKTRGDQGVMEFPWAAERWWGGTAGGAGREAKDQKIVSGRHGEEPKMYRPDLNTSDVYTARLYIWVSLPAVRLVF